MRECDADTIVAPLGLFHSDHELTHEAALCLLRDEPARIWLAYEDIPYRAIPRLLQQRLRWLDDDHVRVTPAALRADGVELKRRAVTCYASQLRGLTMPGRPGWQNILAPERYWRLMLH